MSFDLIETLRLDPEEGLIDLARHLGRMRASAAALGFAFDHHGAANELQAASFRRRDPARVRMRLSQGGAFAIALDDPPPPVAEASVRIAPLPVDPDDWRLRHKTSDRAFYDRARAEAGSFEVLFLRADGFLTEGSFTNVFVRGADGVLRTPPLARGLLPGVLRARLIDEGGAVEADLRVEDLSGDLFIGNSLRGLVPAHCG